MDDRTLAIKLVAYVMVKKGLRFEDLDNPRIRDDITREIDKIFSRGSIYDDKEEEEEEKK